MDTYFIPFNGRQIVYRPLHRLAFLGNQAMVSYLRGRVATADRVPEQPEIEAFLAKTDYWTPARMPVLPDQDCPGRRPSVAVLLMTNRCNLACTYCYAAAGVEAPVDMSLPLARTVIDAAAENARLNGDGRFSLSFHGGGEPTLNWDVLVEAVRWARAKDLPCNISLASNGVWSARQRDFICGNMNSVTLSADGIVDVHDAQRPRRSGRGSFSDVLRSIRALDEAGVDYGIRMTAASGAIEHISDGVRFLCNETGVRAIQVEVSFTTERGVYADPAPGDAGRFVDAFLQAARIGAERGVFVYYSGARPWVISHVFCQAPTQALIATPEGRLVACFEMTGDTHPYSAEFTIGRVTSGGVEPDLDAMASFQRRQEARRDTCTRCFCFWHCCGDCASRAMMSKAPSSVRCQINREVTKRLIVDYIERGDGLWDGRMGGERAVADDSAEATEPTDGKPCPTC
jgi:uncharacterized protein